MWSSSVRHNGRILELHNFVISCNTKCIRMAYMVITTPEPFNAGFGVVCYLAAILTSGARICDGVCNNWVTSLLMDMPKARACGVDRMIAW